MVGQAVQADCPEASLDAAETAFVDHVAAAGAVGGVVEITRRFIVDVVNAIERLVSNGLIIHFKCMLHCPFS